MSQEICRLCLCESNLSPIFIDFDKNNRYTAVLALTTGLRIEPNDGFPQLICVDCTNLVNSALNLRNQCHLSQIKLLKCKFINNKKEAKFKLLEKKKKYVRSNNHEFSDEINVEDGNRYTEFQIQVEFDRLTDSENGGNFEQQDGGPSDFGGNTSKNQCLSRKSKNTVKGDCKIKTLTKKERREKYLELVEGVFDPKGPVKCKICKKTLSKWICFINHAKIHLGFNFMCEYCGKSFISQTQLKRHCRSHHGMKRVLACKHCSYLALDSAQLVLHERRLHTGERPFVCDTCAATYHSRRCLLQHLETHRPDANVQCEQCPQKFKSARHLAKHRYSAHTRKKSRKRNQEEC